MFLQSEGGIRPRRHSPAAQFSDRGKAMARAFRSARLFQHAQTLHAGQLKVLSVQGTVTNAKKLEKFCKEKNITPYGGWLTAWVISEFLKK